MISIPKHVKRFIGVFAAAGALLLFFVSFRYCYVVEGFECWCFLDRIFKGFSISTGPWTSLRLASRNRSNNWIRLKTIPLITLRWKKKYICRRGKLS